MTVPASRRGWGRGWPANRQGDMVQIRGGGVSVPAGVHRDIAQLTTRLLDLTAQGGYRLVPGWCWGYARRPIRGTLVPSNHSWGLAVDLNAPRNPVGQRGDIPMWVVELWESYGWEWGGRWPGKRRDCFAGDTLLVTPDGPRPIRELVGHAELLSTVDDPRSGPLDAEWVKAPVECYGWHPTWAVTFRRRNARVTVRTTEHHRWPVRSKGGGVTFVESHELAAGMTVPAMRYPAPDTVVLDGAAVAQGIVWGDGSAYNRHGSRRPQARVELCGEKAELVRWMVPHARYWTGSAHGPIAWGLPGWMKAVPDVWSSDATIAGFFAGWFATDGFMHPDVGASLSSSDPDAVAWLRTVAPRLGLTITNIATQAAGRSGFGSTKPNYQIAFRHVDERLLLRARHRENQPPAERRWFGWTVESAEPTGLVEEVFCPTVEGRHVVSLATPSAPLLSGQSMHLEYAGTPADAARDTARILGVATPTPPSKPTPTPQEPPLDLLRRSHMVTLVFTDPPDSGWWAIAGNTRRALGPGEPDLLRDLGIVNPKNVGAGGKLTPLYVPSGHLFRFLDITTR